MSDKPTPAELDKPPEEPKSDFITRYEELMAKRPPNPRDLKFQRVVDRYNYQDDLTNPQRGTVRYAWREYKIARGLLFAALKQWVRMIPCRLWWHSIPKDSSPYHSIKVCRRCGAWREI